MQACGPYREASLNATTAQGSTEWRAVNSGCGMCVHFGHWTGWMTDGVNPASRMIGSNAYCQLRDRVEGSPQTGCGSWKRAANETAVSTRFRC